MPRPKKSSYANEKPPLSYVALCAMAIRSSATGKMSLNEIYRFIISTFPYYKNTTSKWRNSLRHNLSFNDCFVKIVQGSENGNKRSLWSLHPNCGDMFEDGSLLRRKRRFTTKRSQNEDGSTVKSRDIFNGSNTSLVPMVRKGDGIRDKIPRLHEMLKLRELREDRSCQSRNGISLENKERKSRLTNFTIERILGESLSSDKNEVTGKDTLLTAKQHDAIDVLQNIGKTSNSNKCTCNRIIQATSEQRNYLQMPRHSYENYPCFSRFIVNSTCSAKLIKSSKETFTLHYKAHWP